MKTRLVLLIALLPACFLSAQVEWKGGTPGQETNWFCPQNWSDNRIPDDFDNVIVPDCSSKGNFYPVIGHKTARVQSLTLHSSARLSIGKNGKLSVLGFGLPQGALVNLGTLDNNGTLEVIEPVLHALDISGTGVLIHTRSATAPEQAGMGKL
ncbi:MAG: hypothetical protein IPH12_21205 [Saprospirales bacterium]|nr:hypothetical protein [Saprospirales bacterium]MBK8922062.1 hypothetical protein [Saprospirales bacterium]